MTKKIITRFPPSPTGFLHVGSLRTALYNYLFAKKNQGKFLLRIEDTDQARIVKGAIENLQEILELFGLKWDNQQPIIQSTRLKIYQKYAKQLVEENKAYYCFCSHQRLEDLKVIQQQKKLPPMYDGKCRDLKKAEVEENLKTKKPHVSRFRMPKTGNTEFTDLVRGRVSFDNKTLDDQIILKSDGFPTYHLASVVDDHEMKVTHVIRGEEWLSSTPKHVLLYQALGWPAPEFAHLPLLLNADRSKLSKRQGDVAVEDYLAKGYLPQALLNFVLLLGWNPGTDQEIFDLKTMTEAFGLEKVNKAGAIFNTQKLDWLNGYYLRQLPIKEFAQTCIPHLIKAELISPNFEAKEKVPDLTGYFGKEIVQNFTVQETKQKISFGQLAKMVATEQQRIKKLDEIALATEFFFKAPKYEAPLLLWKKMEKNQAADNLRLILEKLEKISEKKWQQKNLETEIKKLMAEKNSGAGEMLWPMRVALTGRKASPGNFEVAEALGKTESLIRIKTAIELLK